MDWQFWVANILISTLFGLLIYLLGYRAGKNSRQKL